MCATLSDNAEYVLFVAPPLSFFPRLSHLCQLTLDQALHTIFIVPDLQDFQSSFPEEPLPLLLLALLGGQCRHHYNILSGELPVCIDVRDHVLVDQQLTVAWLHGSSDALEDLQTYLVRPVVEDGVPVVGAGT